MGLDYICLIEVGRHHGWEWDTTDTRHGLRHMTQGRILWAEAVMHEDKLIRVVNVHQATSSRLDLQQKVFRAFRSKIYSTPLQAMIMAGDFNADPTGNRTEYSESNASHLERVDDALLAFVRDTGVR